MSPARGKPDIPTIYEVAAAADVSISTVSLALNSPHRVNARTRERILAAADKLAYVPRSEAASRARRAVGRIGVVAPFTAYSSFARRLNGILEESYAHPLDIVVYDEPSAATSTHPLLSTLPLTHRLDGLIVMALPLTASVGARLLKSGLPTVLVDRDDPDFDAVVADDVEGGRMAARHLLERGGTRFAFFGERQESQDYVSPAQLERDGFVEVLRSADVPESSCEARLTAHDGAAAAAEALDMLSSPDRPDAVFAHDDHLASVVLQVARSLGLHAPQDVAVVGVDDGELAQALGLTTIRQPLEESGRAAFSLLHDRLLGGARQQGARRTVRLDLELVARHTT